MTTERDDRDPTMRTGRDRRDPAVRTGRDGRDSAATTERGGRDSAATTERGRRDSLRDFDRRAVDVDGVSKTVYVSGAGPAVVLMPEMPGISPDVARFGRWVRDSGFTVYMPSLFGVDGAYPRADAVDTVVRRACVSAEFRAFAGGGTSPVTAWLRGLARRAHAECGGPGVGAVGLCFTGNFALTMALEPAVVAPVLNHPSLPLDDPGGLELSAKDAAAVAARVRRDGLTVLAYRFDDDTWCTGRRFAAYRALLGDAFDGRVLPGSSAHTDPPPFFRDVVGCPHSVVTAHLVDREGHPTTRARDEIIAFLADRLHVRDGSGPPRARADGDGGGRCGEAGDVPCARSDGDRHVKIQGARNGGVASSSAAEGEPRPGPARIT
ncbi:dienelactone hydrolase family protein [Streptomyces longispororuber]|uniref:dienelactone hydrolase family protein n=1 Tax=Streptomyces longispororuber TaxID=68230 RepID=UPI0033CBDAF7